MTAAISVTLNRTWMGFIAGWILGSASIVGGRAYKMYVSSEQPVHRLLGHVATPAFRRELAVAISVYAFANGVIGGLGKLFTKKSNDLSVVQAQNNRNTAVALLLSVPIAGAAGYFTTPETYKAHACLMGAVAIANLAFWLIKR